MAGDVPMILDAAHNPDGAAALAEALAGAAGAPVVACLAILADKDAAGIVDALAPALDALGLHRGSRRAARRAAGAAAREPSPPPSSPRRSRRRDREVEAVGDPAAAVARRALELARERGRDPARHRFALPSRIRCEQGRDEPRARVTMNRDARSELLHMMGLVAAVVAIVILVFFGLGYLFGRLFL